MFVAAFDRSGTCLWANGAQGTLVRPTALLVGPTGETLVFGMSYGPWGTVFLGSPNVPMTPGAFLSTYAVDGSLVNVKRTVKSGMIRNADWSGNEWLLCGALVGNDSLFDEAYVAVTQGSSGFIASTAIDGTINWLTQVQADSASTLFHCRQLESGLIMAVGVFYGDGYFGNDTIHGSAQERTFFLAAYEHDGALRWAHSIGSTALGRLNDMELTDQSQVCLMGQFSGSLTLGSASVQSLTSRDSFIAKLDTLGQCISIVHMGRTAMTSGGSMVCDGPGVISSFGYDSVLVIGPTLIPVSAIGLTDLFIARFDSITGFTGVQGDHVLESDLSIYPNPTTGHFTVQFAEPLMADSYYSVYDTMGRLLFQRPLPKGKETEEVDLSRYSKGTYVIKFSSPDGVRHERVAVE